jgi:predicted CopG family antitoxin
MEMVKHIHIILNDDEYRELEKVKGKDKTWKDLLMEALRMKRSDP